MSLTSRLILSCHRHPPSARCQNCIHSYYIHTTMPASLVSLIFAMVRQNNSFENMSVHLLFCPFSRVCAHSLKLALHTGSEIFSDILANNFPSIRHISREYPWRFSIQWTSNSVQPNTNTQYRRSNSIHGPRPCIHYCYGMEWWTKKTELASLPELLLLAFLLSTSYPITIYAVAL